MATVRGRPSSYSPEIADKVLRALCAGISLRDICDEPGMPDYSTVALWAIEDRDGFSQRYAYARGIWLDLMAEDTIRISDRTELGERVTVKSDGKVETVTGDMTEHRKLRIDTRKWILSKLRPDKYGDRNLGAPQELVVTVRPSWEPAPAVEQRKQLPPKSRV